LSTAIPFRPECLRNVLRVSNGLFLECVRQMAGGYPDVAYEEQLIDAMAALLIRDPSPNDVIVTTNMFGDILADEASELSGSLGLAASLNAGGHGVAQAQHGSAPGIAGQDMANPASLIGSAAMLLAWLGERRREGALLRAIGPDRGGVGPGGRRAAAPNTGPGRSAGHAGLCGAGDGDVGRAAAWDAVLEHRMARGWAKSPGLALACSVAGSSPPRLCLISKWNYGPRTPG